MVPYLLENTQFHHTFHGGIMILPYLLDSIEILPYLLGNGSLFVGRYFPICWEILPYLLGFSL